MKASAAAVILIICLNFKPFVSSQSRTSAEFPEKTEKCFQKERLPQSYRSRFQSFQYPDEDIVHKYIYCVSTELGIWDDTHGFKVEEIAQQYRDRANEEIFIPIISKCNQDKQNSNKQLWCYRSFLCILNTEVGEFFKEDVRRKQQARNLPNGHR